MQLVPSSPRGPQLHAPFPFLPGVLEWPLTTAHERSAARNTQATPQQQPKKPQDARTNQT